MTTYRLYLRDAEKQIVGRDDFDAEHDARAMLIARMLRDACSDKCAGFELWQNTRRVDLPCPNWSKFSADEIHAKVEAIVLDRALAIRASRWSIADSARLPEQTRRLVKGRRSGGLARTKAAQNPSTDEPKTKHHEGR
jgi:hypothetical protein